MLTIGIAGGTGSGKSTVVRRIIESLPPNEVAVIPQDCYYKDNAHIPLETRLTLNYDEPAAIDWPLLEHHLNELKHGRAIEMPTYDFITCSRLDKTIHVEPKEVAVVEGILVLCEKELRDVMDIKVFVDADADERLIRVITRDCLERGRTPQMVIDRYQAQLKPMHELHIEPSKRYADLIVPQGGNNHVAVKLLTDYIRSLLPSTKHNQTKFN
jgi:uridine kinase